MKTPMKIAIGCDEAANAMKDCLKAALLAQGHQVTDFGTHDHQPVLYPDIGIAVAQAIARGQAERGLLLCGTGIGMAIAANKVPGIRAAQAHDTYSAERAALSNDAHIITIGARVIGIELAKSIVQTFLAAQYVAGPRSQPKLDALAAHEQRLRQAGDSG
ncbi:ribose-5-phosphate isomerase [Verminephrobacter eiseniae EF01-2]|uniref:Ribose-5-phosphate isomerase n=2 Tax=Verminephrobacter eiseniae TaxID=364317 RepID=A1WJI5_VEREI|nr:ribose-5-phosphate isomerase [Verminephrobacter eiseniae EF01-2]